MKEAQPWSGHSRTNGNCGTSALGSAVHTLHMRRSSSLPPVPNSQPTNPLFQRTHNLLPRPCYEHLQSHRPPLSSQPNATMISSGFTNAPVTQFLVFGTVIGALLAAITDSRFYLHIQVVPHLWGYGQFWRCGVWMVCFISFVERWRNGWG